MQIDMRCLMSKITNNH